MGVIERKVLGGERGPERTCLPLKACRSLIWMNG